MDLDKALAEAQLIISIGGQSLPVITGAASGVIALVQQIRAEATARGLAVDDAVLDGIVDEATAAEARRRAIFDAHPTASPEELAAILSGGKLPVPEGD